LSILRAVFQAKIGKPRPKPKAHKTPINTGQISDGQRQQKPRAGLRRQLLHPTELRAQPLNCNDLQTSTPTGILTPVLDIPRNGNPKEAALAESLALKLDSLRCIRNILCQNPSCGQAAAQIA
jgi:hypothetical protein